jgi:MFS family permease
MVVLYVPAMTGLEKRQTDTAEVRVSREQRWVLALALISMLIFFITTITLPVQLHQSGVSETTAGFYLAFISFMAVIGAFFMAKVVERLQEKSTLIAAYSLYGIAQILFAFTNSWFTLILAAIAMGMGFGLSIPLVNHITIELSDSSIRNTQLAYLSMAIFSGQFLSSVLAEMIDDHLALYLCTTFLAFITAITLIAMRGLRFRA